MKTQRRGTDNDTVESRRRSAPAATSRDRSEAVLAMQRQAGNAATRLWLTAVHPPAGPLSIQLQAAPPVAPAPAVAAAIAEAVNTKNRINTLLQDMLRSTNRTVSNTAQLYTGPSPRLTASPMTRRSDSAAIATQLGTTGTREYFFTGVTQPVWSPGSPLPAGTKVFAPTVVGTIQGTTALIRGRDSAGANQSTRELSSTLVHETSHTLVASYGQHPGNSASFDRYKDEFRAYFIDPFDSRYAALSPGRRAAAIRRHLVGSSATNPTPATHPYRRLQAAYWTTPAFKAQVDAHNRPDGFNLTSSPRLDRLFQLLTSAGSDPTKVDDVVLAITRLPVVERAEAAAATLVGTLLAPMAEGDRRRVQRALGAPTTTEYAAELNPAGSASITGFYDSLVRGEVAEIKTAYGKLTGPERGTLSMNAATLLFIDRHLDSVRTRAGVVGMVNARSAGQFDAVDRFIDACLDELLNELLATPRPGPSAKLLTAVRAMTFETRLGFYRLSADARAEFVDVLPDPIERPIIAILRGERDP